MNKLLKLGPANTNLVTQKQKLLKDAINATKEKLEALKTAQEKDKEQLEKGTLGQDMYDALQREIIEMEEELRPCSRKRRRRAAPFLRSTNGSTSLRCSRYVSCSRRFLRCGVIT